RLALGRAGLPQHVDHHRHHHLRPALAQQRQGPVEVEQGGAETAAGQGWVEDLYVQAFASGRKSVIPLTYGTRQGARSRNPGKVGVRERSEGFYTRFLAQSKHSERRPSMRVPDFLSENQVPFEELQIPPAFSATQRAKHLHVPGRQVAKCVLL